MKWHTKRLKFQQKLVRNTRRRSIEFYKREGGEGPVVIVSTSYVITFPINLGFSPNFVLNLFPKIVP